MRNVSITAQGVPDDDSISTFVVSNLFPRNGSNPLCCDGHESYSPLENPSLNGLFYVMNRLMPPSPSQEKVAKDELDFYVSPLSSDKNKYCAFVAFCTLESIRYMEYLALHIMDLTNCAETESERGEELIILHVIVV